MGFAGEGMIKPEACNGRTRLPEKKFVGDGGATTLGVIDWWWVEEMGGEREETLS